MPGEGEPLDRSISEAEEYELFDTPHNTTLRGKRNDVCAGEELTTDHFSEQLLALEALSDLTTAPTVRDAGGFASTEDLKAIYFDTLDWKGKPTKVFAWLGIPKNSGSKLPAIVLVHGGGGSAYRQWVKLWNAHGFAAISIAVEGQTDESGART